jgi:hypothetical protein
MDKSPGTLIALILMWGLCSLAGITFLRNALLESAPKKGSKVGAIVHEVRFRARLFLGLALLLWVGFSLVWVLIKWL